MTLRAALAIVLLTGCAGRTGPNAGPIASSAVIWRVATYNIHHGRGMDDRVDLERIAGVLRPLDADIIALQEVDERVARSGQVDQARRLGELLGMHHAFGSFMDYQGGRYGLALLSRCAPRRVEAVRLTEGNEPRVALVTEIEQPDGSILTVVNVHFDWVRNDGFRFTQAREVARLLDGVAGPFVLAGDFNDVPGSRTLSLFHERAEEAIKPPARRFTFSSTEPQKEIDFVFAAPAAAWSVESVDVMNERMASDHLPVIAVLKQQRSAADTTLCAA